MIAINLASVADIEGSCITQTHILGIQRGGDVPSHRLATEGHTDPDKADHSMLD